MPSADAVVLPANVKPNKYRLTLQPDLNTFTFKGEQTVDIEIVEPTARIVLNAAELEITGVTLRRNGSETSTHSVSLDADTETVTLDFGRTLSPGRAQLEMEFTGILNDRLVGFYRSEYQDAEGQTRYLATTQFEATDARRAFPCWDEPAQKAVFDVTLIFDEAYQAVSNTPIVEESSPAPGLRSVRFGETPIMSTYLLAFVVGDLVSVEADAADGTRVGIWTTRGKENQAGFALDTSVKLLGYFNEYFGIPYPLPKLDHIAIPDFAAGAMENWGAVTYRETALLVDPENSSAGTRQRVAEVVAHEMAHMWFGDLVTMEWWDDLWLNESFASWMGTKAVDWLFPEWEMWTQFVNMDTNRALSLDGLKNSHPIEQEVKNPAEVSQLFDAISYSKGGSVIRMLENFLGPEVFQGGLYRYLKGHEYGNARTQDLWAALEEESGLPVTNIMDSWVKQTGYPVLQVQAARSEEEVQVSLSQERFVYDRLLGEEEPNPEVWRVPVTVSAPGASSASMVMEAKEAAVSLPAASPANDWYKVNADQTGFYRVNYTNEDWQRLAPAIRSLELPATDRLGIQNDAYALSRAGLLPITQFLELAGSYSGETDASVWSDLASNLRDIEQLIADEPVRPAYQRFGRELFAPAARRAGWTPRPDDGHLDSLLRSTVLGQSGTYNDPETLAQATDLFQRYLSDPDAVHPDLRGVVFSLAAQAGDRATYDQLWGLEERASLQEEKIRLLLAMSRFQDVNLLNDTLERSLSSRVRSQDTITVVAGVAANPAGREPAWEFVKSNWAEFDRRYGGGGFGLMRLVSIVNSFTTEEGMADVEKFFTDNPAPAAERTIRQALERMRLNIRWLEQNRPALNAWFGL
ncbi:MAG: M1 family metallopeptidase [Chloroflexi bacterium]|nr:M1 family metallopeptidase [Chloroflexota bacterium]